ncbi:unnamed protein product [Ilex paraguariensis]|uniref:Response regulatory domain-containing protein n=1 Tax=Ilex paraguariensis TaxID=185542 RepID=A0ABC8RQZ6_9AQUA
MGGVATDAKFHVLAVDDSLIDRTLIERLLKTSSYQVTAVDSGNKALEFLGLQDAEGRHSDLVNVSTNSHDQESSSLKDIPVVIMSSENIPSRINSCLEQGAEEFFLKPVKQADVNKLRPHLLRGKAKELFNHKKDVMGECLPLERTRTRHNGFEVVQ